MNCERNICYQQDYNGGCDTCPCNRTTEKNSNIEMTYEEAIVKFKGIMKAEIDRIPCQYDAEVEDDVYSDIDKVDEILQVNKVICGALEKQVPKKPRETRCALMCANCGHKITEKGCKKLNRNYCKKCGQRILWEVEK